MTHIVSIVLAGFIAGAPPASEQKINDAQIAAIVVTANQVDVDAGKLAAANASSTAIRRFAQLMVTDHTGVNKAAVDLATRLKVTPEDNPTSRALKAAGEKHIATLKTLKGAEFDMAYIDHEVAYHQQVLDALDKVLIPGATNEELKALLIKVRPAFVAHLEHAKQEQAALARPAAKSHRVTIDASRFIPATLTVAPGDKVVWHNADMFPHTATSTGVFDSKEIKAGKSWTHVVQKKGLFEYTCTLHPTMKASLRVR